MKLFMRPHMLIHCVANSWNWFGQASRVICGFSKVISAISAVVSGCKQYSCRPAVLHPCVGCEGTVVQV